MTTTAIIVILAVLLIIGIVRSVREKNQNVSEEKSNHTESSTEEVKSEPETPFQTTQEMDSSYYSEAYTSPKEQEAPTVEQENPKAIKKTAVKKTTTPKKTTSKKETIKKTLPKKSQGNK